jgi:hypothetical protein
VLEAPKAQMGLATGQSSSMKQRLEVGRTDAVSIRLQTALAGIQISNMHQFKRP